MTSASLLILLAVDSTAVGLQRAVDSICLGKAVTFQLHHASSATLSGLSSGFSGRGAGSGSPVGSIQSAAALIHIFSAQGGKGNDIKTGNALALTPRAIL